MLTMQSLTQRLANPSNFMALSARLLPWCWGLAASLIGIGLYLAFFGSPPDYQQGQTVKIMYIHVPAAWLSMLVYALIALSSFGLLVFRHPLADVSAKAAAPLGATFTFLALATGSLWGKPMWGTFWVWDPRLTSVLILFFLYLGLIALRSSIEDEALAAKLTAVLSLVGIAILPAASTGQRDAARRADHPCFAAVAAAGHDPRHDGAVRRLAAQGHAQRDPAPAREGSAPDRRYKCRQPVAAAGRMTPWI